MKQLNLSTHVLGCLFLPQEHFIRTIPKIPLQQLTQQGWPTTIVTGQFRQVADLRELIRYLRNAIAHFNIEFICDSENQIKYLRVWNYDYRQRRKNWEAEFSIEDIKKITEKFSDLLINYNNIY